MNQAIKTELSDATHGVALLDDPIRNKGTAFTERERRDYRLEGLLPHSVESLDRQVERVL
jgi:malate dehydrogenase (oxaloacetate-decarboxylating)(NADP+)